MDELETGPLHGTADGGVAGSSVPSGPLEIKAASATAGEFDRIRLPLIPVACWRVDDVRFEFDSSFVVPEARDEMRLLAKLIDAHTAVDSMDPQAKRVPPLSIFGHADPSGQDDYNKFLSGRRAAAIYGLVTRRDEVWEDLYSNSGQFTHPVQGDQWGIRSIQIMLSDLVGPIAIDGQMGPQTSGALKEFQHANGLAADGVPGPATRKQLFLRYMDSVCVDAAGRPFRLDKVEGFLARNEDPKGKGDFQGCGEFNPLLVFSQQDNARFDQAEDKSERNAANAPNRRVTILLFRPASRVIPANWPCPSALDGVAKCKARFWSDGESRRSLHLAAERKFEETRDTFACRFFHRLAVSSPCSQILRIFRIRLFDPLGKALPGAPFLVQTGNREVRGRADAQGDVVVRDVPVPSTCLVKWSRPDPGESSDAPPDDNFADLADAEAIEAFERIFEDNPEEFEYEREVFVDPAETEQSGGKMSSEEARRRLHNLGYTQDALLDAQVRAYQRDTGKGQTGELSDIESDLTRRYSSLDPPPEFTA